MKRTVLILLAILSLVSCGRGAGTQSAPEYRRFPAVKVPGICTEKDEIVAYLVTHFWDGYFAGGGVTDSAAVLGVRKGDLEQGFADYLGLLDMVPMAEAQKSVGVLFGKVEACQAADTSSLFFLRFTEMAERYFYDPNSPLRNEDWFLPFVRGLASSPYTREDMRAGYAYQAQMCAMNQVGTKAPDFRFKDARERVHSLYAVKAEYTMLFFSNPFCPSCKSIMDDLATRPYLDDFIARGRLAVVNIYIDEEHEKWLEYEPTYPRNWLTGYDWQYSIREDRLYDVRAIPSLYLLDRDKNVIMKDAPTERVLAFLDRIANDQNT